LLGQLRDRALLFAGDALLWRPCLAPLNRARASVGLAPVAHPLDQVRRAHRVLIMTSTWFDFDAPEHRGNVRYVGAELADPSWAAPWTSPWPDDHPDPLVLVALSSSFMDQGAIIRRIISALSSLRVRALVTVGPALDVRAFESRANIVVCASAPHAHVLPGASLVITHAGHGTVLRSLACGVPMVCMPMGRDQGDNAARAEAAGAAITLSPRASARAIRRAVERAIGDGSLRAAAREAADRLARERRGDRAVEELEALLVHRARTAVGAPSA
jgi:MGT family glycosyltransferase